MTFLVKDHDTGSENDDVAQVHLSHEEMLSQDGERVERRLEVLISGRGLVLGAPPVLVLRIRKAVKSDFKFMEQYNSIKKKKKRGIYADTAFVAPQAHRVNRLKREIRRDAYGSELVRIELQRFYRSGPKLTPASASCQTSSRSGPSQTDDRMDDGLPNRR